MNIDQVDRQLSEAHLNMATRFHDRMLILVASMFVVGLLLCVVVPLLRGMRR